MESLLAGELRGLGADRVKQARAGVSFEGSLQTAYRVCLWSRLAGRILLPLANGSARDGDQLYAAAQRVNWETHLGPEGTLAVDFTGTSDTIRDTRYGAVRIKDAIADQFRERHGGLRPSVDVRSPDVRVNGHLVQGRVTISLDLSGESLHRRGYRTDKVQVEAPLKEHLAAAMLLFAAWPQEADAGGSLLDPLCGSGTLPVEAAMMAADVAPGLLRAGATGFGFGFLRWRAHDKAAWDALITEAHERRRAGLSRLKAAAPCQTIGGSDHDPRAVDVALACVRRAGLQDVVTVRRASLGELRSPAPRGLVVANLPYGERLGRRDEAEALTAALGERLRREFPGWRAALLTGGPQQARAAGLDIKRETTLRNGPIEVTLAFAEVSADARGSAAASGGRGAVRDDADHAGAEEREAAPVSDERSARAAARSGHGTGMLGGGAEQFANRLRKNVRRLGRQLRREDITCYRVYDADLPEFNLVVDVYGDWVHVQEYAAPGEIDPAKAERRLEDAVAVVGAELDVPPDHVVMKQRRRQRGTAQYERRERSGDFLSVSEDDLAYLVNLRDYLDTGLFIDQRLTRRLVRSLAGGRRFLNLFAYTGTMTVNALAGGSPSSTTVDLSSTYLEWAGKNLEANGFKAALERSQEGQAGPRPDERRPADGRPAGARASSGQQRRPAQRPAADAVQSPNRLVQADCLRWLAEAEGQYDLIWLDPPTFSNSKRMGRATFDVQRDHPDLLRLTARRLLAPGGVLLFATNRRGFHLERADLTGLTVTDLSRATLPFDCTRAANRHHVFRLEHGGH
jgi:23S rRNA (guanine2445-N2)-methyltransferase / 23S rRNA (guanine2069-N7)-methyltransferase